MLKNTELEIERRWLLRKLPNFLDNFHEYLITQWYTPAGRFRYMRLYSELSDTFAAKYYHTIKETIAHGINKEIEKEITVDEYLEAVKSSFKVLTKLRYIMTENGLTYEIDHINVNNQDYFFLEIELDDINQKIEIPDYIRDFIIREVTGDKSLSNFNLAKQI